MTWPEFPTISLRAATEADRDFLAELYAGTREEELRPVEWPTEAKRAFLRQQFEAQDVHYRQHYIGAAFDVITDGDRPIGRLYVHRSSREIRMMDVALVPDWQNRGLGSAIVRGLLEAGRREGRVVTLHVEPWNPAKRLYERLGFRFVELRGAYEFLEADPGSVP